MKKTYIAPNFLLVKINSKGFVALSFDKNATGADADVVLTKEYDNGTTVTDKSVWDNEW